MWEIGKSSSSALKACIPVLAEIPHSRRIAEGYAKGNLMVVEEPALHKNVSGAVHEDPGNSGRACLSSERRSAMKELVIISGKGGTGKTTLTACFAFLAKEEVLADCDVDAADLHILAHPTVIHEEDFRGGVKAAIDLQKCVQCGACSEACRFGAISAGLCRQLVCPARAVGFVLHVCPEQAISLKEGLNGHWFISETRFGSMVHAALLPGEENSGKLVALVRNQAKVVARKLNKSLILVDGAPGVGCPRHFFNHGS